MKFALYEFVKENALWVGASEWCNVDKELWNNDSYDFDGGEEVLVRWPGGKMYLAKIRRFSGKSCNILNI